MMDTKFETKNTILQEDLEQIVEKTDFSSYMHSSVLITGATGLVGSRIVLALLCANRMKHTDITVYAVVRNLEKAKRIYEEQFSNEKLTFIVWDITQEMSLDVSIDYVIHTASVTASKFMVEKPVETIEAALLGTRNILNLAKEKKIRSMVYLSSMEMYGRFEQSESVTEDMCGSIDTLAIRSNYPLSKRMCENMCVAYHAEHGVPVKIARLAQVFGAGILPGENRVFAQFARSAMAKQDIVLHTAGKSEGNYCYLADAIRAIYVIMSKGIDAQAYNVVNEETHITIADMAKMVAKEIAKDEIQVVFDIPETNTFGYAADTKMKLSSKKLKGLGWAPIYDLSASYKRMVEGIRSEKS